MCLCLCLGMRQGNLNNCWLIGGMQLLASSSKLFESSRLGTILAASPNADGDVEAQLFIGGEWRSYKVTKQIPATSEGDKMSPLYAHPPNEAEGPPVVWGTMAEKIVAKAYGGYGVCGNAKLSWRVYSADAYHTNAAGTRLWPVSRGHGRTNGRHGHHARNSGTRRWGQLSLGSVAA